MSRKIFCIVNPHLRDRNGHYFEYDHSLIEPARKKGYEVLVLGHKQVEAAIAAIMPVKKVFSREIWQTFPLITTIPQVGRKVSTLIENILFYRKLRATLNPKIITSEWVIFSDMVCHNQLLAWAWWFRNLPRQVSPRLVLLFRYSSDWFEYWSSHQMTCEAFRILNLANFDNKLCLCSDSDRLAKEYSRFTTEPLTVVPIPHTTYTITQENPLTQPQPLKSLGFVSLGNARDEKGFLDILQAIKILHQSGELDKFTFILQANNISSYFIPPEELLSAVEEVKSLNLANVYFICDTLSSEEYYRLLQKADVVLLPYWRSIYVSRTSGIFTEALAAGKPVIVTEDTWMSEQLSQDGAGVLCRDRDSNDLVRAILKIAAHYEDYANKAKTAKDIWLQKHNPDALLEALVPPSVNVK
jgi:glycosyltransferase involved in cell wall biosynthesis